MIENISSDTPIFLDRSDFLCLYWTILKCISRLKLQSHVDLNLMTLSDSRIFQERMLSHWTLNQSLPVIRQKGESQKGCYKKTKHAKFSEKWTFLTPWYTHVRTCAYQMGKKCLFFGKFGVLCFLFLWDSPFCFIPTDSFSFSVQGPHKTEKNMKKLKK